MSCTLFFIHFCHNKEINTAMVSTFIVLGREFKIMKMGIIFFQFFEHFQNSILALNSFAQINLCLSNTVTHSIDLYISI